MSAPYLLATTTNAVWLLDPASGNACAVHTGGGVYYGITFTEEMIFVAHRQVPVGADRPSQDNGILCFDRNLRLIAELRSPWPIRDVHQIFHYEEILYICSTFEDVIVEYSLRYKAWNRWFPFGDYGEVKDANHINSIFVDKQGFLLAGTLPSGWFASFDTNKKLCGAGKRSLGVGTHNVWRDGDTISVCSSNESAIVSENGRIQKVCERGWVRGVAKLGASLFIGVSQNLVRDIRGQSDCMIARLDADGMPSRLYTFLGFGMLHDIRTINAPDDTHNGLEFKCDETFERDTLMYPTYPYMINL